ncbi:MAG TPA: SusE domain-containing protein [Chitinophagaceae bacterium]
MRSILNFILVALGLSVVITACDKVDDLPLYGAGSNPVLSASSTNIAALPADSNKTALTLNWTYPNHATDSSNIKYTIEIDSAGKNFANPYRKIITDSLRADFTAKELNNMLLAYGYPFNLQVDMDVRLISSYANNNEALPSNIVKIKMTPYKVPPKVPLPTTGKLFIVGSATQGDWGNPVPLPSQEFYRIDETTFGGIFQLHGGKEYLLLPLNGNWDHKFAVADNTVGGLNEGGNFGFDFGQNIPGPAASGLYKIIVDFQTGKFSVTPFTQQHGLPAELFIVGDATPGDWANPVPVPSQQFTRVNSTLFEISLPLNSGKKFVFLPENGNWGMKFGAQDASAANIKAGGIFKPEGQDMPAPDVSGNYKIQVNFINNTYTLTKL